MFSISAVLIVKNEQENLPACLAALDGVVDEIVVADTGSSDRSIEIAEGFTERVFRVPWTNDFAAARNAAIAHARGAWILSIDADECVEGDAAAGARLRAFIGAHAPSTRGTITIHNVDNGTGAFEETVDQTARFFHREHFRFAGPIHEQLAPLHGGGATAETGVHVIHTGYAHLADDPGHKSRRNIPLLLAALEKAPEDEYLYFQLGKAHYALKQYELAAHAFEAALSRMRFDGAVLPAGYTGAVAREVVTGCLVNLAYAYVNLGRAGAAMRLLDEHAGLNHPAVNSADFAHVFGYVCLMLGDITRSRMAYETSLALGPQREDVLGTGSFASLYHLGLLDEAEGRHALAAGKYAAALALRPAYLPALARGISWITEGRPVEAAAILAKAAVGALAARYIERIAQSLQNGKPSDAQALITAAPGVGEALGGAVAAWLAENRK